MFDGKRRPCLYYHLDQCLAPCAGKTDAEVYGAAVEDARMFMEGRGADLRRSLEDRMREASDGQQYEAAARHRDMLRTVESLAVKQRFSRSLRQLRIEFGDSEDNEGEVDYAVR